MKKFFLLLSFLGMVSALSLSASAATTEDWDIYIVPLKFRTPADLISPLSSLFQGRAKFSFMNGNLLASSDEKTHRAITKIVSELDHRPKQLKIELISASQEEANKLNRGFSIRGKNKNGEVQVGTDKPNQGGIGVSLGDKIHIGLGLEEENRILQDKDKRSIVLLEGSTGEISYGQAGNKLIVTPRITGSSEVEMKISQSISQGVDAKEIQTTRAGALEQWLDLGGLSNVGNSSTGTIGSKETGDANREIHYWIRAREVDNVNY